jgi:hypothetical protein
MGDFFLLQMDDYFTEDLCFDNRKEGKGSVGLALPHSAKGKAKGRSPVAWELRPYDGSRCAEHWGVVAVLCVVVCTPHRG